MKDFFVHLFIPRQSNNHRAKVLHIDFLTIYVLFFMVFNISIRIIHRNSPDVLGYATDIYIDQLLADTNLKRINSGLEPLVLNNRLTSAAEAKAQDMFSDDYWAHNSPSGKTPWEFITRSGYKYRVAGENLAKNFNDSQAVVDAWMASPSHRDNILKSSYRDIGFAVVNGVLNGEETTLVVQMFGATNEVAATEDEAPPVLTAQAAEAPAAEENSQLQQVQPSQAENNSGVRNLSIGPGAAQNAAGVSGVFSGVSLKPAVDLNKATKETAFIFIGFLIVVFAVDAYIITHKRIIRIAGHNLAHILFLSSLTVALLFSGPGSII